MSVPGEAAAFTCRHCGQPIVRCHAGCSWRHPQPLIGYPVISCGLTAEPGEAPPGPEAMDPDPAGTAFRQSLAAEKWDQGFDVARLCGKPAIRRAVKAAAGAERERLADLASELGAVIPADHPPGAMASFADYIRTYGGQPGDTP